MTETGLPLGLPGESVCDRSVHLTRHLHPSRHLTAILAGERPELDDALAW